MPIKNVFDFTTNLCNYRCRHCFLSAGPKLPKELPGEERIKFYPKLREHGIKIYNFLGGLPSIHPYFLQMYKYATAIFPSVRIQDNGSIDLSNLPFRNNFIIEYSLEDSKPEFNDWIREKGDFEATIRNIILAKRAGFKVFIRSTIFQSNDIKGLVDIAKRLDVGWVGVRFLYEGRGAGLKEEIPTKERLAEVYEYVEKLRRAGDLSVMIEDDPFYVWDSYTFANYKNIFIKRGSVCPAAKRRIAISPDGKVVPCQMIWNKEYVLGDITKDSWEKIEENAKKFTDKIEKMKVREECQTCKYFGICHGACKWYAIQHKKIGDPFCPLSLLEGKKG
ncbi:MAG: SPASM domain-containing protein [Candidatus Hodarchaeales archaeon]